MRTSLVVTIAFAAIIAITVLLAPLLYHTLVKKSTDLIHPTMVHNVLEGITVKDIDGKAVSLNAEYRSKVVLVVNVASHCGFTELNYRELQKLQARYATEDFTVLAFPCNQFGNQEADPPQAIAQFARETKHATFPLFEKVDVNGDHAHPLFQRLKSALNVTTIEWNFGKFLLGKGGVPLRYYDTRFPFEVIHRHIDALVTL